MAHVREQIRDAVVATLTGLTTTGPSVHSNPEYDITESQLPCLIVKTDGDTEEMNVEYSDYYRFNTWDLPVLVQGIVQDGSDSDEVCDDIAAEVQVALAADIQLAAALSPKKVWYCIVRSLGVEEPDGEKAVPTRTVNISLEVRYRTSAADPTTLIS